MDGCGQTGRDRKERKIGTDVGSEPSLTAFQVPLTVTGTASISAASLPVPFQSGGKRPRWPTRKKNQPYGAGERRTASTLEVEPVAISQPVKVKTDCQSNDSQLLEVP